MDGRVAVQGVGHRLKHPTTPIQSHSTHIHINQTEQIAVRNLSKPRDFTMAGHTQLVGDWRAVLDDPEINTVVEVMGGVTDAKEVGALEIEGWIVGPRRKGRRRP